MAPYSCTLHYCGLHELLDDHNIMEQLDALAYNTLDSSDMYFSELFWGNRDDAPEVPSMVLILNAHSTSQQDKLDNIVGVATLRLKYPNIILENVVVKSGHGNFSRLVDGSQKHIHELMTNSIWRYENDHENYNIIIALSDSNTLGDIGTLAERYNLALNGKARLLVRGSGHTNVQLPGQERKTHRVALKWSDFPGFKYVLAFNPKNSSIGNILQGTTLKNNGIISRPLTPRRSSTRSPSHNSRATSPLEKSSQSSSKRTRSPVKKSSPPTKMARSPASTSRSPVGSTSSRAPSKPKTPRSTSRHSSPAPATMRKSPRHSLTS